MIRLFTAFAPTVGRLLWVERDALMSGTTPLSTATRFHMYVLPEPRMARYGVVQAARERLPAPTSSSTRSPHRKGNGAGRVGRSDTNAKTRSAVSGTISRRYDARMESPRRVAVHRGALREVRAVADAAIAAAQESSVGQSAVEIIMKRDWYLVLLLNK